MIIYQVYRSLDTRPVFFRKPNLYRIRLKYKPGLKHSVQRIRVHGCGISAKQLFLYEIGSKTCWRLVIRNIQIPA